MDKTFNEAIDRFIASLPIDKLRHKLESSVSRDVIEIIDKFYDDFFNDWLESKLAIEPWGESTMRLKQRVEYMKALHELDGVNPDASEGQKAAAKLTQSVLKKPDFFEPFDARKPDLAPTEVGIYELFRRIRDWQDSIYKAVTNESASAIDLVPAIKQVCLGVAETCTILLPQILHENNAESTHDPVATFDQFLRQFHSLLETQAEMLEVHREVKDRREFS